MNQGIKGIGLFFTGWILALTAYYLGALDTGIWMPLVVTGVEIFGLSLMIAGIRQTADQLTKYKAIQTVGIMAVAASLGMVIVQVFALQGITIWMSIAAIFLALAGDILFMILTGLVLFGLSEQVKNNGNEREANRLAYLWAMFLTFAILYLIIQVVAVLLVNEGLSALTYIVPIAGLPLLIVGAFMVRRVYRIYQLPSQETNQKQTKNKLETN